jgi:hypothetical protein
VVIENEAINWRVLFWSYFDFRMKFIGSVMCPVTVCFSIKFLAKQFGTGRVSTSKNLVDKFLFANQRSKI